MATPRPIDQPPVMSLIRDRRKKMHLSYDRAGALAGISGTRWRQLEDGYRTVKGIGRIPEEAPPATLARMAYAVGATTTELDAAGATEAVEELAELIRMRASEDKEVRDEAARMVSVAAGLTAGQRERLEKDIAADLRRIREQGR